MYLQKSEPHTFPRLAFVSRIGNDPCSYPCYIIKKEKKMKNEK